MRNSDTSHAWSVIVPVLDEAGALPALLTSLEGQDTPHEVVVVDGGSRDGTPDLAAELGARVVAGVRGRSAQMNLGASHARGTHLLFAHADMILPADALQVAHRVLQEPGVVAGCYQARFRSRHPLLWGGRWKTHLWVRMLGFAPGDHGLFLHRDRFAAIEGYPDMPILEDRHICRRLRRHGRIAVAPSPVEVSARRFHSHGTLTTYLRMARVLALDSLGASAETLDAVYHGSSR